MEVGNSGQMSAPGFTVSVLPSSQTFITLSTSSSSSTTQIQISTAFQTVTVSATASPSFQDGSTNRAWIAGAVIGPIVLLLILLVGVFFLWRRRWQTAFKTSPSIQDTIPTYGEESQKPPLHLEGPSELHEDTLTPQPQELYGSFPSPLSVSEPPTKKVPAQELPADEPATRFELK